MPSLAAIRVFPIKSLDGVSLDECRVLPGGAIERDRCLAIADKDGNFVNGKRHAAIHQLRTEFDLANDTVKLSAKGFVGGVFHLYDQQPDLEGWLGESFGFAVRLQRNDEQGFPDDVDSPGPTIVSRETLETVSTWFVPQTPAEMSRRFRANLEVAANEPFWEDRLFAANAGVRFRIGDVEFLGNNPCQRCVVPTRSSDTGEPIPGFTRIFSELRQRTLPPWSAISRFDHYYRLAVNTRLEALHGGRLRVGNEVQIIG